MLQSIFMNGKRTRFVNFLYLLMSFAAALPAVLVLGFSLVTRMEFRLYEENDLYVILKDRTGLLILFALAILLLILWRTGKSGLADRSGAGKNSALMTASILFAAAYSLFLIFLLRGLPTNDANTLNTIINAFSRGDFSELTQKGSYMDVYPFQIGYVLCGQILHRIFGENRFLPYTLLNTASIAACVRLLQKMTWEISGSRRAEKLAAALSFGMLAFYTYAPNIYNDIWSMAPQFGAVYLEIRYLKSGKTKDILLSGILLAIAVLIKQNCLITLVAMELILAARLVSGQGDVPEKAEESEKPADPGKTEEPEAPAAPGAANCEEKWKAPVRILLLMLFLAAAVKLAGSAVGTAYARAAGLESFPEGMPKTTHIAMGLDEAEGKYGWYDGLNVRLYKENGCDKDAADAAAKEFIVERLKYFARNPKYGVKFFLYKFLSQWGDPTCASMRNLEETSRHVELQPALETSIIYGTGRTILHWIMNVMHTLIYLGLCLYLVQVLKKGRMSHGAALIIMMIIGGMLFHEIWEASSRYVLRYYVLMLVPAACGLDELGDLIHRNGKPK